ncbi:hypothetical protein H1Q58_14475 [Planococcus maritimus]|uniref:Uncharacterized protein n=1 Tax=Planococcus maritimus TaxID=192421 RepID=A0A7D7MB14_PLAMR|nr:hypothetical protein [Planococcus maritimus]QMT17152.1 hypothetical protein H1Q58_14475 [Planococcus maritimus]
MKRYIMYETYRLGILIDHLKTEDLIRQIDEYIEETPIDQIPHVFYVLSLASNRRIMIELLTDLARGVDEELPASIVAGLLYKDRERYTVEELYRKIGMLASLLSNEDDIIASSFRELKVSYDELQAAYGRRFKRKKARERMLARSEKVLEETLAEYASFAEEMERREWWLN